jgi:hypothetical protein
MIDVLLSNFMMGTAICAVLLLCGWSQRSNLSIVFAEPERGWRRLARIWGSLMIVLIVWVTLRDNWLQLVTEPYRLSQQWDSERVVMQPVARQWREISLALVALSLIPAAALFARHIGGYILQVALLVVALCAWFPVFIFRQRLDLVVNTAPESSGSLTGAMSFVVFWVLRTLLGIASVMTTWAILVLLIAPLVTFVLDRMNWRAPRISGEASGFYAALGANAAEHADVQLSQLWKPIVPRA